MKLGLRFPCLSVGSDCWLKDAVAVKMLSLIISRLSFSRVSRKSFDIPCSGVIPTKSKVRGSTLREKNLGVKSRTKNIG